MSRSPRRRARQVVGEVPGGQAELLRVPQAQNTTIKVPEGPPDERFAYLSDVLPTAWQAVEYAGIPDGGTVVVLGLGPIGDVSCRIAVHHLEEAPGAYETFQKKQDGAVEILLQPWT